MDGHLHSIPLISGALPPEGLALHIRGETPGQSMVAAKLVVPRWGFIWRRSQIPVKG
jgi:hypothetical protein